MKKLLVGLGTLLVIYLLITFVVSNQVLDTPLRTFEESYRIGSERWHLNMDSLRAALPTPEGVSFQSPVDGITLRGWLYRRPESDCAVLFAHGYHDNRVSMLKYTPVFADCHCDLLLYDHRGFGESDEAYATGGVNEARDLLAAHAFLRSATGLPDERIGWVGESWGASAALIAAADSSGRPAFVVAESPYADWESAITERGARQYGPVLSVIAPGTFRWASYRSGVDVAAASPLRAAPDVRAPVLLIHSLADTLTDPAQSDLLAERLPEELLTYRRLNWGAWHAHNIVWRPGEYADLVRRFIAERAPDFCTSVTRTPR
ncbi:alpha/beta hydrolase [Lewinella sp. IMCC34183]|uniref:alpha/beta hydrolase n=1 Tax=Lewinella sp. IMCC34183 TaxID=2248762 RepID=UPI0013006900|nr:alpha/beta fold hydrolase [Lewinella sp. IMCC34183]